MAEIDRWALERACWARGIALVCGCDEAGAGPLAGAVYAGAVILPPECSIEGLNDSKQVTPKRRDALYDTIRTVAVAWAVARVEAEEIDATDILSARIKAMQMAIDRLGEDEVVVLDEERKAAMVSNLLVVLCGNRDAQPVVNSGSIY